MLILSASLSYAQVTEEWINIYPGYFGVSAAASVIDDDGNIYITGNGPTVFQTGSDYYTIKVDAQGILQWEATYNGSVDGHDYGVDIALDPSGNVYVTGESPGVVNGFGTGKDYLTIKYDPQGNELWTQRFYGNPTFTTKNYDSPRSIAVDLSGNVYVTGSSWADGQTNHDCLTIKYDTNGNLIWTARYEQAAPGSYGQDVKVDAGGNVYVFGVEPGPSSIEFVTIKYNSDGIEQWVKNHSAYALIPAAMEIDENGNVYVTGGDSEFNTVKYNSSGDSIWSAIFNGPQSIASPSSLTVDSFGNVYVTGMAVNAGYSGQEYATVKYNSSGQELWSAAYDGFGDDQFVTVAEAIALDATGNVYVTGISQGANWLQGDLTDYATVKYNNDGVEQWAVRYHRPPDGNEFAIGVHVSNDGQVYVSGEGEVASNPSEIITIKYSQSPADIQEINSEMPSSYSLQQNYPNPFNPSTRIKFQIVEPGNVNLKVYDILGNEITTLVNEEISAGTYEATFDAAGLSSGIYFYTLVAGSFTETKKMILLK
jgi:hypothetical protein